MPDLFTPHGYPLDQAISAVQKMIRRGQERDALFWALEVEGRYYRYIWYRLHVIASEDVGIADSSVAELVDALHDRYLQYREEKAGNQEKILLAHAVLALCRAPKSRVVDDYLNAVHVEWQEEAGPGRREVPDVALDKHTREGRLRGRDAEHFVEEGSRLADEVDGLNVYREEANENRLHGPEVDYEEAEKAMEAADAQEDPQQDAFES